MGQSLLEAPNSVVSRDSVNCLQINSHYISAMNTWTLLRICLNLYSLFIEYLVSVCCEHPCMPAYMIVSGSTTPCVLLWYMTQFSKPILSRFFLHKVPNLSFSGTHREMCVNLSGSTNDILLSLFANSAW